MGRRQGGADDRRSIFGHTLDLVAPLECAGCTLGGVAWCAECARYMATGPVRVRARADIDVPVWASGRYAGPGARAVSAFKDAGRTDLAHPFGRVLADLVEALWEAGEIPDSVLSPLVFVPVPVSARARRRRGMDHVREIIAVAAAELAGGTPPAEVAIAPLLGSAGRMRDSAGLSVAQRAANISGHIIRKYPRRFVSTPGAPKDLEELAEAPGRARGRREERLPPTVLVVDDVVTTGATLAECIRVLDRGGLEIAGAVALLAA